ncbi:MAG: hypothetical protein MUF71_13885 [Candidatus Kapabacteria bacterium]|jgi:hypothetical protein|nr:hypothetical protein [Candidatus Kapabacteria bacterium]
MNQERALAIIIRLLAVLCLATIIIAASLVIMALRPSVQQTVEARAFVLRDSAGRVRAELSVDKDGNAALMFVDSLGRKKVVLK